MATATDYILLPFQFGRFQEDEYLIANESGEFLFIPRNEMVQLIDGTLPRTSCFFDDLRGKQFIVTGDLAGTIDMVATRYRTRKKFLANFTTLHMMVLTLRCNQDCKYCQVSSESDDAYDFDMKPEVAEKAVEFAFMSPAPVIKIEFQGGEPTLNWEALTRAVMRAEAINKSSNKVLEFVICTNLTNMTRSKLEFLRDHQVCISTSLDGPEFLHNTNRILRKGGGTYATFIDKLQSA